MPAPPPILLERKRVWGEGDIVWYIDPIGGTVDFARGLPFWCISLGVAVEGKLVTGVIYASVAQAQFPDVEVIMQRHSYLLDV